MIDNVHQVRIKCMFETIDSCTSNKFWHGIKQSNDTSPEVIIGKCARSTNVSLHERTQYLPLRSEWEHTNTIG